MRVIAGRRNRDAERAGNRRIFGYTNKPYLADDAPARAHNELPGRTSSARVIENGFSTYTPKNSEVEHHGADDTLRAVAVRLE
jgi:hypothetical protein